MRFVALRMVPEFDEVCWMAPLGEVVGPVKTQFGYHLIVVTARTAPSPSEAAAQKDKAQ